jgi:hypothetical protein
MAQTSSNNNSEYKKLDHRRGDTREKEHTLKKEASSKANNDSNLATVWL